MDQNHSYSALSIFSNRIMLSFTIIQRFAMKNGTSILHDQVKTGSYNDYTFDIMKDFTQASD